LHFLLLLYRLENFSASNIRETLFLLYHSYALFALSLFGESLLPIFRKTFVSCVYCLLPLFTWAFASLPLKCLLCAQFCTSFVGVTCPILCPFQLGHLLGALLVSIVHTPVLVGVFSPRHLSFCRFILDIFLETLLCWSLSHPFSSLLESSFGHVSLVCPLAFGCLLRGTILSFLFVLVLAYWSYLLNAFLQFAHLLGCPSLKYCSII